MSNLIGVGTGPQNFVCKFDNASAGYGGKVQILFDKRFTMASDTADSAWTAVKSIADPEGQCIVYVALVVVGSKSGFYAGKTTKDLKTRYSSAGPTAGGGLQQVFQLYTDSVKSSPTLDVTIYGTSHPCFIEGWCFQVGAQKGYGLYNKIDPN
ncbi:hypothetical protein [Brevundimonas sp.]|uniref:hypothetical protein n=1 Tax=Brevundimonas sp. TaxID=1871086 RepID=UPI002D742C18|nr:hypothetical protein [Brevundimonas sp.]HYC74664.1 hypothetical protein [Brevundimonas sp.]